MESTLKAKIGLIENIPGLKKENIQAMQRFVESSDDWGLLRINPYAVAEKQKWNEDETVDLFVHAARVGIFDFNYNMLCPRCGGVAHAHHELDQIEAREFYCAICTAYSQATLDDQVEVSFAVNPAIRKIKIDDLESLETYNRYHFSANFEVAEELTAFRKQIMKQLVVLNANQSRRLELHAGKRSVWQFISIDKNSSTLIGMKKADGTIGGSGTVTLGPNGFNLHEIMSREEICEITVLNATSERQGFMVTTPDLEKILEIVAVHPTRVRKFLTAKMLLNNQTFRELYRVQSLSKNLNLNIRSLTIMFTDLRGSTEMYDKAGDVFAYALVQEHFTLLTEAVRENHGAIIKTMGDAIMAAFSTPEEGMRAAVAMIKKIDVMNERLGKEGYSIGLKVGLHEGPALAVMRDERLDYFGQTVNIAARVQGLAKAGEIWVSESAFAGTNVKQLAAVSGYSEERQIANLKGVGAETIVYKLTSD